MIDKSDNRPFVSIVIPMLDERTSIEDCVGSFDDQTYPESLFEVIIVDGGSVDGSLELVEQLQRHRPWLRLISNPDRRASAAFNRGIEASHASVVGIVGAHSRVGPDFLHMSVDTLLESNAAGVGGVLEHQGRDPNGSAIGMAMTSRFGMASPFRFAAKGRDVDTIGHPVYRREVLDDIGLFDEALERNSDYELNYRIRAAGYRLFFDPRIVTTYNPRGSLRRLARQFFDYGRGKAIVAARHPGSVRPRHLAAPALVLFSLAAPGLARFKIGRTVLAATALTYSGLLWGTVFTTKPTAHGANGRTFVMAFPTMHVTWGAGFITGLLKQSFNRRSGRRSLVPSTARSRSLDTFKRTSI